VAGVVLLIASSLGAILVATTRTVTARSLERAASDLAAARSVFYSLVDDRAEFAGAQTALVTALPVFRSHMTDPRLASDVATLQAMADEYRQQLRADFLIVTDRDGSWTARSGPPVPRLSAPIAAAIAVATANRSSRDVVALENGLFLVVSEPARFAEEVLGTLTVGYALDDAVVQRLSDVTHCDVNLVAGGRLYASSLSPAGRTALTTRLAARNWLENGVSGVWSIGADQYVVGTFPMAPTGSSAPVGRLMLLQDWRPTQQFVDEIRHRLLAAGAVIFVIAVGGSLLFSRRMSRPVQDLAEAAEDIAGGNWMRQVPVRGTAEAAMMAQAVNDMTTSLRHWYEEAKRRDDELRQTQKLEAIGQLAGGVAHDFNNLLTAIKGYGELVLEAMPTGDPRCDDIDAILQAADRAASLTRQLLAFSRRQVVTPRVISLGRVVAETEKILRRLIGEDITLTMSIDLGTGLVKADPNQMEQVLLNLAVNARDAMPQGGTIRMAVTNVVFRDAPDERHRVLPPGHYARLSVTDTGCGMPAEVVSHIFEPFFTTKEEGKGTGLGLATVYGIVNQAGGTIDIETEVNHGTAFHVYLPQTTEAETAANAEPSTGDVDRRGTETILLVEDELRVETLIANALRQAGYSVLEAANGDEALALSYAHATSIDLLLTDVVMPGMNGRELAERLKLTRRETRVLYMSGYSDDAILRHGLKTASVHFIQKPFSMKALAAKIRETLKTSAASSA
jgi:signal transduction histidine kinase/ActR/RegA family two-component response regulator